MLNKHSALAPARLPPNEKTQLNSWVFNFIDRGGGSETAPDAHVDDRVGDLHFLLTHVCAET